MTPKDRILASKIVAIIRLEEYSKAVEVARALVAGGISVLEFTLTGRGAITAIEAVGGALGGTVCVGVGSVLRAEDADAALSSGAEFLVTPAVRPTVIAIDIDRYKQTVNDVLGVAAGDNILIAITRRLRRLLKPQDTLARLGGDQFGLILMSERDPAKVADFAEAISQAIMVPISFGNREISLTASFCRSVLASSISSGTSGKPGSLDSPSNTSGLSFFSVM